MESGVAGLVSSARAATGTRAARRADGSGIAGGFGFLLQGGIYERDKDVAEDRDGAVREVV